MLKEQWFLAACENGGLSACREVALTLGCLAHTGPGRGFHVWKSSNLKVSASEEEGEVYVTIDGRAVVNTRRRERLYVPGEWESVVAEACRRSASAAMTAADAALAVGVAELTEQLWLTPEPVVAATPTPASCMQQGSVYVTGRPSRDWLAYARAIDIKACVRIDDLADPEFWCEVWLDAAAVTRLAVELGLIPFHEV